MFALDLKTTSRCPQSKCKSWRHVRALQEIFWQINLICLWFYVVVVPHCTILKVCISRLKGNTWRFPLNEICNRFVHMLSVCFVVMSCSLISHILCISSLVCRNVFFSSFSLLKIDFVVAFLEIFCLIFSFFT